MTNFVRFLKVAAINIIIAAALVFLLAVVTLWILKRYTHHGEALSVPDFSGMTLEEVGETCRKCTLKFEVIDSVYSNTTGRGTVVDQSPRPEFKVKENRTIFLTINAFYPERVKCPNVTGVSLRQATALLETYGLKPGKLTYKPDWATNNVLKQTYKGIDISEGTMVEKWSEIDLVVGKASYEKGIIPDVKGLLLEEAHIMLNENGFNVGIIEFSSEHPTKKDSIEAIVWRQSPGHHKKNEYSLGTAVDLWLTTDSTEVPKKDTALTGSNNP